MTAACTCIDAQSFNGTLPVEEALRIARESWLRCDEHRQWLVLRRGDLDEHDRAIIVGVVTAWNHLGGRTSIRRLLRVSKLSAPSTIHMRVLKLERQLWLKRTPAGLQPGPVFAGLDNGHPLYLTSNPPKVLPRRVGNRFTKWERRGVLFEVRR